MSRCVWDGTPSGSVSNTGLTVRSVLHSQDGNVEGGVEIHGTTETQKWDDCRLAAGRPRQLAPASRMLAGLAALGLWTLLPTTAWAQPPLPQVPDITQRSGLLMRFAGTPEFLPTRPPPRLLLPDPIRRSGDAQPHQLVPVARASTAWAGRRRTPRASIPTGTARPARAPSIPPASPGRDRSGSSRDWPTPGGRSGCITRWAPMSPSTTSTRSRRDPAPTDPVLLQLGPRRLMAVRSSFQSRRRR